MHEGTGAACPREALAHFATIDNLAAPPPPGQGWGGGGFVRPVLSSRIGFDSAGSPYKHMPPPPAPQSDRVPGTGKPTARRRGHRD